MLKYAFVILITLLCLQARAQKLQGVVMDAGSQQPVPGAIISAGNYKTISNNDGIFEIPNPIASDTLKITSLGFYPVSMPMVQVTNFIRIPLYTKKLVLNQVDVVGKRNYSQDSLRNRRDFDKSFNYKAPTLMDALNTGIHQPGDVVGVSPSAILAALTHKSSNAYKLQQHLVTDERENYIDSKFNARIVTATVGAKGDTLQNFLRWYRPGYDFVKASSDYELLMYIRTNYQHFSDMGFKADDTPPIQPLVPADKKNPPVKLGDD